MSHTTHEAPDDAPEAPLADTPAPEKQAPETPAAEADPLLALAYTAKAARLSPADEERATTLLKERLLGKRAGIDSAVPAMIEGLSWSVCVNAVSAVWEQLSAPMRRHLLGSIAKNGSESAQRLRLSLARAIFKLEPTAGLKLAAAAVAELKNPETGTLTARLRLYFYNVFIGKGKPWLLQLPLADLKVSEADALVHCAIQSLPNCPPAAQISILHWAADAGRLKKAKSDDLGVAAKSVSRWGAKHQRQLRAEIPELPPELEAALKPEALKPEKKPEPERTGDDQSPHEKASEEGSDEIAVNVSSKPVPLETDEETPIVEPLEELFIPGRAERLAKKAQQKPGERVERGKKTLKPLPDHPKRGTEQQKEKPAEHYNLREVLRGVEQYVALLRAELEHAKTQIRHMERDDKRGRRSDRVVENVPPAELEALTRHNTRLEETVADLRTQLEDLAAHHESIAESCQMHSGEPLPEGSAEQLCALLAIKLAESYETYQAMLLDPLDKVFRLDFRDLLGSVFEVLQGVGVKLKKE